jgi:hypothetical protein
MRETSKGMSRWAGSDAGEEVDAASPWFRKAMGRDNRWGGLGLVQGGRLRDDTSCHKGNGKRMVTAAKGHPGTSRNGMMDDKQGGMGWAWTCKGTAHECKCSAMELVGFKP